MDNLKKAIDIKADDPQALFQIGQLAAQQGDYEQAIQHLNKALVLQENYKPALEALFKAQLALKRTEKARLTAQKVEKLYPDDALGNYFSALVYQSEGNINKSIEEYTVKKAIKGKKIWEFR